MYSVCKRVRRAPIPYARRRGVLSMVGTVLPCARKEMRWKEMRWVKHGWYYMDVVG